MRARACVCIIYSIDNSYKALLKTHLIKTAINNLLANNNSLYIRTHSYTHTHSMSTHMRITGIPSPIQIQITICESPIVSEFDIVL